MSKIQAGQPAPVGNGSGLILTITALPEDLTRVTQAIHDLTVDIVSADRNAESSGQMRSAHGGEVLFSLSFDVSQLKSDGRDLPGYIGRELRHQLSNSSAKIRCDAVVSEPIEDVQKQPLFWKRWVVSMLGVYPLLIIIYHALKPLTENVSAPISLFLVAFVLTGLNTRYVMPFLMRKMHSWLEL